MDRPKKSIQCTTEPLEELIECGETIDFRLDEPQWADLNVGDVIEYWEDFTGWQTAPSDNSRHVRVKIINIFKATAFIDLFNRPEIAKFYPENEKGEIVKGLNHWWSKEKEHATGVMAFHVQIIPS